MGVLKKGKHAKKVAKKAAKKAAKVIAKAVKDKLNTVTKQKRATKLAKKTLKKAVKVKKVAQAKKKQAKKLLKKALKPKPKTTVNKCDISYKKAVVACSAKKKAKKAKKATKATKATKAKKAKKAKKKPAAKKAKKTVAKKGRSELGEGKGAVKKGPKKLSKKAKCLKDAKVAHVKCKKILFKKNKLVVKAKNAKDSLTRAKAYKKKTAAAAKALAKYEDVKVPRKPPSPVGIFEYKNMLFLANKDGSRSWIRYPTKDCYRARTGVVPQQFPMSKSHYELNEKESKVACQAARFNGAGNPDFYKYCNYNGHKNKKGHGFKCAKFGYKTTWCYVNKKWMFGNAIRSKEVPEAKVLVGCKVKPPAVPK